jgi:hypothetical protein
VQIERPEVELSIPFRVVRSENTMTFRQNLIDGTCEGYKFDLALSGAALVLNVYSTAKGAEGWAHYSVNGADVIQAIMDQHLPHKGVITQ